MDTPAQPVVSEKTPTSKKRSFFPAAMLTIIFLALLVPVLFLIYQNIGKNSPAPAKIVRPDSRFWEKEIKSVSDYVLRTWEKDSILYRIVVTPAYIAEPFMLDTKDQETFYFYSPATKQTAIFKATTTPSYYIKQVESQEKTISTNENRLSPSDLIYDSNALIDILRAQGLDDLYKKNKDMYLFLTAAKRIGKKAVWEAYVYKKGAVGTDFAFYWVIDAKTGKVLFTKEKKR